MKRIAPLYASAIGKRDSVRGVSTRHTNHRVDAVEDGSKTMRLLLVLVGNFASKCLDREVRAQERHWSDWFAENIEFPRCSHAMEG